MRARTALERCAAGCRALVLLAMLVPSLLPFPAAAAAPTARGLAGGAASDTRQAAAAPSATNVDTLLVDVDGDGRPDPGDTIRYTVAVTNTGAADLTGVVVTDALDPNTALVPGSLQVSAVAIDDSYMALKNTPLAIAAPGVLANDSGVPAPAATPQNGATALGGSVALAADGSFTYTPPADYSGSAPDSFAYIAANTLGSSAGQVVITVEAAPEVVSAVVGANDEIEVVFSEPVSPSAAALSLQCPSGVDVVFAVSADASSTSFTLTPNKQLPPTTTCVLRVLAAEISDIDTNDPPDSLAADYVLTFTTADPAPAVTNSTPAPGAANVSVNGNLSLTFSEPVNLDNGALTLECPAGSPQAFAIAPAGPSDSFTIDPTADLPEGTTCTLLLSAGAAHDDDTVDPPDTLAADYTLTFTTDSAPEVASTTPANGDTDVATGSALTVAFSEPVNLAAGAFALTCAGAPVAFDVAPVLPGGVASYTITPSSGLPATAACALTVSAVNVSDVDTGDAPDQMASDVVVSFTTADPAPTVVSTVPANGAAALSIDTAVDITFSESVTLDSGAFTFDCGGPVAFSVAPAGAASTFTVTPNASLPEAATCTLSLAAAAVHDADSIDPPDTLAANYAMSFSTDAPPEVASVSPADASAGVALDGNVVITFSEPVIAPSTAFSLNCGGVVAFSSTASPDNTQVTLDPTLDLPSGATCTLTINAALVADADGNDPPDTMAANFTSMFSTDAAPTVLSTTPANGVTGAASTGDIVVTFSEAVNVGATAFSLSCGATAIALTNTTGSNGTSFTLTPATPLVVGATCTLTIVAGQVSDADANDPPDTMAANYVASFTVDDEPTLQSITPADGATGLATNTTFVITWSEPVNAPASAFVLNCGAPVALTATASPDKTQLTIAPDSALPSGATCTLAVDGDTITDVDAGDPPDTLDQDYSFSWATDAPPAVTSSSPTDGATAVALNSSISVTFSEIVNATASSFTLSCGVPVAFTVAPAGASNNFTLTPTSALPQGTTCTVTVLAANVTDADAGDPPDTMVANVSFSFSTVDATPTVQSIVPANGATQVATNLDIVVTFSEPVDVSNAAFELECPSGSPTAFVNQTASPAAAFTLRPSTALPSGTVCAVRVLASEVTDADAIDPPNQMTANFTSSFTTDTPPAVTSTTPLNGALNVAPGATITVNFDESVNAALGSFSLECPTGAAQTFTLSSSPANSFTLTPDVALPAGALCTVTVTSAGVTDADAGDPPDTLAADYVFSFGMAPAAAADTYPQTVIGNVSVNSALIPYSVTTNDSSASPVTITTFDATSAQGGSVTMTASGAGVGQFTYNPPVGYEGPDSFTYTIGTAGGSATATVSLTVSGMVWFVDGAAAVGGDGRLSAPLNSLAAFNTLNNGVGSHPAAGDSIFVYENSYLGPLVLLNDQRLIGQDATGSLASLSGLTPPSGSAPFPATNSANGATVQITSSADGIVLAQDNRLYGFTLGNATDDALLGAAVGALTVRDVSIATTGRALNLTNGTLDAVFGSVSSAGGVNNVRLATLAGSVNLGGGALSGSFADAFDVNGGSAAISYAGTVTKASSGYAVAVRNTTGGSVTLASVAANGPSNGVLVNASAGNVTLTALNVGGTTRLTNDAVTLTSNTGTTTLPNVSIATTDGRGIVATNGGTLSIGGGSVNAQNRAALDITGTAMTATLSTLTSSASTAEGVKLDGISNGSLTVGTTSITNPTNECVQVRNSAGRTFSFGATSASKAAGTLLACIDVADATGTTNAGATFSFSSLSVTNGNGTGVLANTSGTLTISSGSVTATNGAALDLTNTAINISLSGITTTNSPLNGLALSSVSGAGLSVSGATSLDGAAGGGSLISVSNSTATNLAISTGTTVTLADRRGAGVQISGSSGTIGFGATTIANPNSATGDAFIVQNSSAAITLPSLTISNAQADAVQLTGTTGSFTVNGGSITTSGESALEMDNADNVTFRVVTIDGTGSHAINALSGSSGLSFIGTSSAARGVIRNAGNGAGESALYGSGLVGTVLLQYVTVESYQAFGAYLTPSSGTLNFTVSNAIFQNDNTTNGETAVQVTPTGSASGTVSITNNTFTNVYSMAGFAAGDTNTSDSTNFAVTVSNNVFNNTVNPNRGGDAIDISNAGGASALAEVNTTTVTVSNNTLQSPRGGAISLFSSNNGTLNATVQSNTATNVGIGSGLRVNNRDNADTRVLAQGNTFTMGSSSTGSGIEAFSSPSEPNVTRSGRLDINLLNNSVGLAGAPSINAFEALYVETNSGNTACVNMSGNTANGGIYPDFALVQLATFGASQLIFQQLVANTSTPSVVEAAITANNTAVNNDVYSVIDGGNAVQKGTCNLPLMAEGGQGPGGVSQLRSADLYAARAEAIALWERAGVSALDAERLRSATVEAAELPAGQLGAALGMTVQVDTNAAGWGWSTSGGRMDLTTVVAHELGHLLGLEDAQGKAGTLMASTLPVGEQRSPAPSAPQQAATVTANIGTLPAGERVLMVFDVVVASPLPDGVTELVNQATVAADGLADTLTDDPAAPGASDPTVTSLAQTYMAFLPFVAYPALPDLVIDRIVLANGSVQVVVKNQGVGAVTAPFWVDLYINPSSAPTAVNEIWPTLAQEGMVWGVTSAVLPLDPGETLTLTPGDALYAVSLSNFGGSLPAGATLYAQADSWNPVTTFGAVFEHDERPGQSYNNITRVVVSTAGARLNRPGLAGSLPIDARLPERTTPGR